VSLPGSLRAPVPISRLPIWRLVALSYVDVWRAMRAMPMLFGCAAMIVLAVRVAIQLLPQQIEAGPVFGTLSAIVEDAVQYFCLTPIMVALHRFVIRGDITRSYTVDLGDKAFFPFFAWTMVLSIVWALVSGISELLLARTVAQYVRLINVAVLLTAYAVLVWLALRLMVLFPAIAVGANGATARHAFADTKGDAAKLLAILVLAFIPPIALGILFVLALGHGVMVHGSVPFVIGDIGSALMGAFITTLSVVIASYVYLAVGRMVR
jgi:hypothetical protein